MNKTQWTWLTSVAAQIPRLFKEIATGKDSSNFVMGERVINNKVVRLSLVAQVVDAGGNPLASHASATCPSTPVDVPDGMVTPAQKRRSVKRSNHW